MITKTSSKILIRALNWKTKKRILTKIFFCHKMNRLASYVNKMLLVHLTHHIPNQKQQQQKQLLRSLQQPYNLL